MTDSNSKNRENDFEEALRQFIDAQMRGEKPDIEEFVNKYPEFEGQIRQKVQSFRKIDALFDTILHSGDNGSGNAATGDDLVGQQIGSFEIIEMIGRGGMGVVYLARDTKLDRFVAIKSMPAELQTSSTARTRFVREAKLLASLSHPNIGVIHDIIESTEGCAYLVLEYVPGETLAERMAREPLGLKDALSMGLQIAEAVCAAHEEGVIHRDLKPSNIKITPDGRVKVLDFGLAKITISKNVASGPTVTQAGRVMGTPAYMSPEQARGKAVDRRTDIWSFGCLLYEMLTGHLPFEGETTTDVLARIIEREPDWNLLPEGTPLSIRVLLWHCLAKDPRRRLQHIGDAVLEIDETLNAPPDKPFVSGSLFKDDRRRRWQLGIVCGVSGVVMGLIFASIFLKPTTPVRSETDLAPIQRFAIELPENQVLFFQGSTFATHRPAFAVSPDGSRLVYVARAGETARLFERRIDRFGSKPIPGTEGASSPFFSPDGRSVGFFADEKLKTVSLLGGNPVTLCPAVMHGGGSWGGDGMIYFVTSDGLLRVPAAKGVSELLLADSELVQGGFPQVLPDSKAVLISSSDGAVLFCPDTMEKKILVKDVHYVRYLPSGHLIYTRAGAVEAVSFDLARRKVTGRGVPVLEGILLDSGNGLTQLAFSDTGLLVYAPGGDICRTIPVWVDRQGNVEPLGIPGRIYGALRLSPDGKRLAIVVTEEKSDIWIYDITGGTETRLTKEGNNNRPLWTPDGRRIVFEHYIQTEEQGNLLSAQADGSGETEVLMSAQSHLAPWSWSPDGKWLAFYEMHPKSGWDISILSLEDGGKSKIILGTEFVECYPTFSPRGRYIAYMSNRDGNPQIYICPFPSMNPAIPISRGSGEEPLWSANGDELFYRNRTKWMAVSISTEPEFVAGTPQVLFEGPYGNVGGLSYDVSLDGQRFMVLKPQYDDSQVRELHVVTNWFEELKRLAPSPEAP